MEQETNLSTAGTSEVVLQSIMKNDLPLQEYIETKSELSSSSETVVLKLQ